MICKPCKNAADQQAPKSEHCNDEDQTQCFCQHDTSRYRATPEPAEPIEITPYLVIQHYRTDHGTWAWSWRCWGDGPCDGHLALDLSNRAYAERKAREHLAAEHPDAEAQ